MSNAKTVYIMVDYEGGACIVGTPGLSLTESTDQFELARRVMTREANAAAEGAFAAGVDRVIINDAHGSGVGLLYEDLHSDVEVLLGSPRPNRYPGMDRGCIGLCFVGYHAMSGTADAVLSHSYSSKSTHRVWINGVEYGEVGMDAAYAGTLYGVPTIFVSGDDKVVAEANALIPGVETVTTKQAFGRHCALSLTPEKACRQIRDGVKAAVQRADEIVPLVWEGPLEVRRQYKHEHLAEASAKQPNSQRIDGFTVVQRVPTVRELLD